MRAKNRFHSIQKFHSLIGNSIKCSRVSSVVSCTSQSLQEARLARHIWTLKTSWCTCPSQGWVNSIVTNMCATHLKFITKRQPPTGTRVYPQLASKIPAPAIDGQPTMTDCSSPPVRLCCRYVVGLVGLLNLIKSMGLQSVERHSTARARKTLKLRLSWLI